MVTIDGSIDAITGATTITITATAAITDHSIFGNGLPKGDVSRPRDQPTTRFELADE
jgi:hypothetical protein